jgi:hypothetical protein
MPRSVLVSTAVSAPPATNASAAVANEYPKACLRVSQAWHSFPPKRPGLWPGWQSAHPGPLTGGVARARATQAAACGGMATRGGHPSPGVSLGWRGGGHGLVMSRRVAEGWDNDVPSHHQIRNDSKTKSDPKALKGGVVIHKRTGCGAGPGAVGGGVGPPVTRGHRNLVPKVDAWQQGGAGTQAGQSVGTGWDGGGGRSGASSVVSAVSCYLNRFYTRMDPMVLHTLGGWRRGRRGVGRHQRRGRGRAPSPRGTGRRWRWCCPPGPWCAAGGIAGTAPPATAIGTKLTGGR